MRCIHIFGLSNSNFFHYIQISFHSNLRLCGCHRFACLIKNGKPYRCRRKRTFQIQRYCTSLLSFRISFRILQTFELRAHQIVNARSVLGQEFKKLAKYFLRAAENLFHFQRCFLFLAIGHEPWATSCDSFLWSIRASHQRLDSSGQSRLYETKGHLIRVLDSVFWGPAWRFVWRRKQSSCHKMVRHWNQIEL